MHAWRRRDAEDAESGAVSVFVIMLAIPLLMMAGLIFDGGGALNQRAKAADDAEQAARAGAQQIDLTALRDTGAIQLDPTTAEAAARQYLVGLGYPSGSVRGLSVTGNTVSVEIRTLYQTKLLSAVDIKSFPVDVSATARAAAGIETEINPP